VYDGLAVKQVPFFIQSILGGELGDGFYTKKLPVIIDFARKFCRIAGSFDTFLLRNIFADHLQVREKSLRVTSLDLSSLGTASCDASLYMRRRHLLGT
jgi:hypothetical protein